MMAMSVFGYGLKQASWRVLVLVLALLQVSALAAQQGPAVPLTPAAQKVKTQVSRIAIDGKLTAHMKDGSEYHGRLESIDSESFSVREVDLKQTVTISYADVDRVTRNYGGKGFGGKRVDPKKSLIAGIALGGLLVALIALVATDKS
jgi:hypothetical protein